MVLSSDHITGATGVTPTVTLSKNGAPYILASGTVSEIANGVYALGADEFDANTLGPLMLHAAAPLCDPRDDTFTVVQYNPASVQPLAVPTAAQFGTVRAIDIINRACIDIGILAQGETLSAAEGQDFLGRLNGLVSSWATQSLTMPVIAREEFDLVAGQQTYTIGPGADWDSVRPIFITGCGLLLTGITPNVELPIGLLTEDAYRLTRLKGFSSIYPTQVYYNPTFATTGWAEFFLWPMPTTDENRFVLYSQQALTGFASLVAQYVFPPGYEEALEYALCKRLAPGSGKVLSPELLALVASSLGTIKRANATFRDLALDPGLTFTSRRPYNVLSDQ
jgi:hypothetical protein